MATNFKILKDYLYPDNGNKTFVIPNYQRGYKWSVRISDAPTSVEYLIDNLIGAYTNYPERQYFLQGVTVAEEGDNIILIDGQQRTTTLYLLLWSIGIQNITGSRNINLDYTIREKSKEFINKLKIEDWDYNAFDSNNLIQDIYYFKQAICQIQQRLKGVNNKEGFLNFLLNKVSLLYIVIDKSKAVRTFTMMNGHKATMHDEELTKAEILHLVSLPNNLSFIPDVQTLNDTFAIMKEMVAMDWETNALRSKYAREWDKWLYWWNRQDVKDYFNTNKPMGLLLEYYYRQSNFSSSYSFKNFKKLIPDNNSKSAKNIFKELRDLQKDFEDIFNNPLSFNYLKCAMVGSNNDAEDKFKMIMYFIGHKHDMNTLEYYAKWRMIGATHIEITEEYTIDPTREDGKYLNSEKRRERAKDMLNKLSEPRVYNVYDDIMYKQLLRLNVKEYNSLNGRKGVKFDFSIWEKKSIEHIYPKSKFYHKVQDETSGIIKYINGAGNEISESSVEGLLDSNSVFSDNSKYSEHCIGNLVLLYGRDNSEFNALPFEEKKKKFFNNERGFDSRNLLHTISSFANSTWGPKDIEEASVKILNILSNDYIEN